MGVLDHTRAEVGVPSGQEMHSRVDADGIIIPIPFNMRAAVEQTSVRLDRTVDHQHSTDLWAYLFYARRIS